LVAQPKKLPECDRLLRDAVTGDHLEDDELVAQRTRLLALGQLQGN
jgi:hypothetical protein